MRDSDSLSQLEPMRAGQHMTAGLQTESLRPTSCPVSMGHCSPPFRDYCMLKIPHTEFWDLGHKLFRSSAASFPAAFIHADLLDQTQVAPGPPSSDSPDLSNLSSLNQLRGHVTAIHASALFHLFSEEKQLALAQAFGSLLAPVSGACIFGWSTGIAEAGHVEFEGEVSHPRLFCHSPSSWEALWNGVVFPKGSVEVDAHLREFEHDVGVRLKGGLPIQRLEWVVRRI